MSVVTAHWAVVSSTPWHRCREEPRLFGVRCKLEDGIQFVLESHIEHLIRLVQNEVLDLVQFQGLALHQINQSARSGDDDVARSLELRDLRRDICAAINGHTFDAFEVLGKEVNLFGNLLSKLPRWCQN